ncbi:MAG: hypothetical protein ACRBCK_08710 [Alphaproteobacteria bacterium]
MQIPPTIAAEAAQTRQNVALSGIKKQAEQAQALANVIEQAVDTAPTGGTRGTNVNITV